MDSLETPLPMERVMVMPVPRKPTVVLLTSEIAPFTTPLPILWISVGVVISACAGS